MGNLCSVWGSSRKGKPQVVVEETRPRRSFDEEGFIFRTLDENVEDLISDGEKIKIQNHRILNRKKIEDGRKMSVELMPSGSEDVRWTQPLLDNFGFELSLTGEKFTSCHTEQERKKLKERASSEVCLLQLDLIVDVHSFMHWCLGYRRSFRYCFKKKRSFRWSYWWWRNRRRLCFRWFHEVFRNAYIWLDD